jgi:5-methylcytosine-specific restriction endonuclease McrA
MRLCSGCRTKIPEKVRFCADCKAERTAQQASDDSKHHTVSWQQSGVYDAVLDGLRKCKRWLSAREATLRKHPFCNRCQIVPSAIADHIIPAAIAIVQTQQSGRFPYDKYAGYYLRSNLQGLCHPCHGAKTVEDKEHKGQWPSVLDAEDNQPKKVWSF